MLRYILCLIVLVMCYACQDQGGSKAKEIKAEIAQMKTQIDMSIQGFEWAGADLDANSLDNLNQTLNNPSINPSLTSPCMPPSPTRKTIRYQEHYRCGALSAVNESCELWEETIPLEKSQTQVTKISDDEASLIFHRALNYSNVAKPKCTCQKRPSIPISYKLQANSIKDETNQTLTKKIWVTTTYNCCGACID